MKEAWLEEQRRLCEEHARTHNFRDDEDQWEQCPCAECESIRAYEHLRENLKKT